MSQIINEANLVVEKYNKLKAIGAGTVQEAINAGNANIDDKIGIFSNSYTEWVADGGTEQVGHISYYPKTKMAYRCAVSTQRIELYSPDVATNNYNPYLSPDNEGIYPYVNGMTVWKDMIMRYNDKLYKCILPSGTYKLIYAPDQVPSVMEKIEQE